MFALRRAITPLARQQAKQVALASQYRHFSDASLAAIHGLEPIDVRRKQLIYRAGMRGWLELDVLCGNFAKSYAPKMDAEELELFNEILTMEAPDLFKWLSGQLPLPENLKDHKVMNQMIEYVAADKSAPYQDKFDGMYFHECSAPKA